MRWIILSIIIIAFTFGTIACVNPFQSAVFLSTSSPNKTYIVELTGNKSSPSVPFVDHETRFNLFKGDQPLVKNAYLSRYDWFDSGVDEMYPEHKWISDSVLRLSSDISKSEKVSDYLVVSNKTNKTIKYLRIVAGDMLFIFEMPPNSKSKFSVPYLGDLPWVTGEGEFADGQHIKGKGVNFLNNKKKLDVSLHYCISVSDDSLRIESPILDGYNGDGGSDKPNIPKAENCDL
jgi:hypothetical protein